ncbi:MAG: Uma2 family endonuclease [Chloroflexaceae bacterium]|jgi:Uma2 family endonuclease|nr:Uma2 family endonuclease [Chloroflexaceae bacterium]
MAVDTRTFELKLIRRIDGVELDLFPLQGLWTEEQYLRLTDQTNHLIEFTDGEIEVLPMPTSRHQVILLLLYELFKAVIQQAGGKVLVAPLRLQVRPGKFREPDLLMLLNAADPRYQDAFWLGADIVVEIVSPNRPERDLKEKPQDYAEASIPEYWIVNPLDETITVLTLDVAEYRPFGVFHRGDEAGSSLLPSLRVNVNDVFDAR